MTPRRLLPSRSQPPSRHNGQERTPAVIAAVRHPLGLFTLAVDGLVGLLLLLSRGVPAPDRAGVMYAALGVLSLATVIVAIMGLAGCRRGAGRAEAAQTSHATERELAGAVADILEALIGKAGPKRRAAVKAVLERASRPAQGRSRRTRQAIKAILEVWQARYHLREEARGQRPRCHAARNAARRAARKALQSRRRRERR